MRSSSGVKLRQSGVPTTQNSANVCASLRVATTYMPTKRVRGSRLRRLRWAPSVLLGACLALVTVGCGPFVESAPNDASQSPSLSVQGVDLVGPVAKVMSGEMVVFAAQTKPPTPGLAAVLETFAETGWLETSTSETDTQGSATWSIPAPSAAGAFQYRAVIKDSSGATLTTSNVVIVGVARASSALNIAWPKEPLVYCEKAEVTVVGAPEDANRIVRLEAREQGRSAETIDLQQLDATGRASLQIPPCPLSEALFAEPPKWRIVLPETESAKEFSSTWTELRVGEPPVSCPSPQAISIYANNPDFRASYFEVSNPSGECSMIFTVTAEFFCAWDGPDADAFILGTKTSTPYSVPPSDTLTFVTEEVFSNSAATCRDRIPPGNFGGLEFRLGSESARAIAFEPEDQLSRVS